MVCYSILPVMELLTVAETAKLLRVSLITVRRRIAEGQLRAVRVGKGIRVPMEALKEFLAPVERVGRPATAATAAAMTDKSVPTGNLGGSSDEEIDRLLEERISPAIADSGSAYLATADRERAGRESSMGYFLSDLYDPRHDRLTPEEQERARLAMERARRGREKLLAKRGGRLFPSSGKLLNEIRDERSRQIE